MRVKRYEGSTMKDALDQVRQELGPDAVILEARRSRGRGLGALLSILGFGKAPVFEVMAAADGDDGGGRDGDGASGFTAVTWVPSPLTARAKAETADEAQAEATEPALQASAQTMTGPTMQVVTPPRMPEVPLAPAISPSGPLATLKVLEREAAVRARAAGLSPEMAFSIGSTALYGFPGNYMIVQEVSRSASKDPEEQRAVLNYIMPPMIVGGYATVTIGSVFLTGILINFL